MRVARNRNTLSLLPVVAAVPALAMTASVHADSEWRIVITEIMYNPASPENTGQTEWVEIANLGGETVEIKDWRLDDEDDQDWGRFSCTIEPGGVVVLINGDAVKESEFREAWDENPGSAEPSYQVISVQWSSLANSPSDTNEILQLLDEHDDIVCEVNYQSGGDWPTVSRPDGPSIWLSDLTATDLNRGELWKRSEDGLSGARKATTTPIFFAADIGSPGYVDGLAEYISQLTVEAAPQDDEESAAEDEAGETPSPKPVPDPVPGPE